MIDVHAHYDDERFSDDLEDVMARLKEEDITAITSSSDVRSSIKNKEIAERYSNIYFTVGVHPHEAEKASIDYLDKLKSLSEHSKCVAIGEIGLDFYYDFSPRDVQKKVFIEQIELALELKKPIVVHDREAHKDTLDIIKQYANKDIKILLHCYSGSLEMAKILMNYDISISVGGVVTFNNAKKLVEVVKEYPLDLIMLETDAPYLTPVPHRGKRNDSTYLKYVVEKVAQIKGITIEEVIDKTKNNAKKFFGL